MARRPIPEEDDVSLFPFLSIIAAIIGVLTLMIAAVTINQLNQEEVKAAVQNSIELDKLEKLLFRETQAIDSLKLRMSKEQSDVLKKNAQRQQELVKTDAELNRLIKELEKLSDELEQNQKIEIVIPEIPESQRESLADMQSQLIQVRERLAVLQKELSKRENPEQEAEVSILPGGSGISFTPRFVECAEGSLVLHTEKPTLRMRTGEAAANPKFVKLLEDVANSQEETIIFLVRSDGVGTYYHLRNLCDKNDVRNGKLPVVGNGKLDFSHFAR